MEVGQKKMMNFSTMLLMGTAPIFDPAHTQIDFPKDFAV